MMDDGRLDSANTRMVGKIDRIWKVWAGQLRGNPATCCNLHNYKAMSNLSVKTIIAADTGNYTAWTSLTSCIMANGSLLVVGGRMAVVTEKATKSSCFNIKQRKIR